MNELIILPTGEVPQVYTEDDFSEATKTGDYLPRLQLMTASSEVCKTGAFPINHFAIVRDQNMKDLGKEVNILVIAWRPKALQISDEIISIYNTKDPEFARIRDLSGEKDSGAMYGPEFLVWIPDARKFATFFMGTKSMRREATVVNEMMRQAVTLKGVQISNAKYTWFSAKAERCTTVFDLPDQEDLEEEYKKFINPPQKTVERVQEDEKASRTR
jgi:hypothetical protein